MSIWTILAEEYEKPIGLYRWDIKYKYKNYYRVKTVIAKDLSKAIKKAHVENIIDVMCVGEQS